MRGSITKKFRCNFKTLFLFISIGSSALIAVFIWVVNGIDLNLPIGDMTFPVVFTVVESVWTVVLSVILSFFLSTFFYYSKYLTITLSKSGINGFNTWGKDRFIEWGTIKECKTFNLIGLRYLRVYTFDNKPPLWVPLFLNDEKKFKEALIQFTDSKNSMRYYFELIDA